MHNSHRFFEVKNFQFTPKEQQLFLTQFHHESFSENCNKTITRQSQIFIHYITLNELHRLRITISHWPDYITARNTDLQNYDCDTCGHQSQIAPTVKFLPPKIMFIEFASDAIDRLLFHREIIVCHVT